MKRIVIQHRCRHCPLVLAWCLLLLFLVSIITLKGDRSGIQCCISVDDRSADRLSSRSSSSQHGRDAILTLVHRKGVAKRLETQPKTLASLLDYFLAWTVRMKASPVDPSRYCTRCRARCIFQKCLRSTKTSFGRRNGDIKIHVRCRHMRVVEQNRQFWLQSFRHRLTCLR